MLLTAQVGQNYEEVTTLRVTLFAYSYPILLSQQQQFQSHWRTVFFFLPNLHQYRWNLDGVCCGHITSRCVVGVEVKKVRKLNLD